MMFDDDTVPLEVRHTGSKRKSLWTVIANLVEILTFVTEILNMLVFEHRSFTFFFNLKEYHYK